MKKLKAGKVRVTERRKRKRKRKGRREREKEAIKLAGLDTGGLRGSMKGNEDVVITWMVLIYFHYINNLQHIFYVLKITKNCLQIIF